jgi:alkylation response protein AidB-like acyl-CoA dehydrogenase
VIRPLSHAEPAAFVDTEEQQALRSMLSSFFSDRCPAPSRAFRSAAEGLDLWSDLGQQLGVLSLALPQSVGGDGQDLLTQSVVFEAFGAVLAPVPSIGCLALAAPVLAGASDAPAAATAARDVGAGKAVAALVAPVHVARFRPETVAVSATSQDGKWVLHGRVKHVLDGSAAGTLLVPARTTNGFAVFVVDAAAQGVGRTAMITLDTTRERATVDLSAAPGQVLLEGDTGVRAVQSALCSAQVLLAAEQVGGAAAVMSATLDHVRQRVQFGRTIGSFQVVKHRLVDMYIALEHARSAVRFAASAVGAGRGAELSASIAQISCSQAYRRITAAALQLHGGIGFTWEHDLHLYLKRAVSDEALLGSPAAHLESVRGAVLDGG